MKHLFICFCLLGLLSAGCKTTRIEPWSDVGHDRDLEQDERKLWDESREAQRRWTRSGYLVEDDALREYLSGVLNQLVSDAERQRLPDLRVEVILDPSFNAFAYPNGVIYIHLGMLVRMENEAQLATLLAHEISHSTHRHGIKSLRQLRNQSILHSTMLVGTSGITGLLTGYTARAAISGYSRELETEADEQGWHRMQRAGYDVTEAPRIFEILLEEVRALELRESFFFATHPALTDRIASYGKLQKRYPFHQEGRKETGAFLRMIAPYQIMAMELDLRHGRFQSMPHWLERADTLNLPRDEVAYLRGEWIRRDSNHGQDTTMESAYLEALEHNPDHAPSLRALGLLCQREDRVEEAIYYYSRYLDLEPTAPDRAFILNYIEQFTRHE